jgi:hypothetical protein
MTTISCLRHSISVITLVALTVAAVSAQSLSINSPGPLKPGVNAGQTDNFTGTHYWYFYAGPGAVAVHCEFKGGGLLGNPLNSRLTFTLSDATQTWHVSKTLVSGSSADASQTTFHGNLKQRTKVMVTVAPVAGGLVRMGGEYSISVSGTVAYGQEKAGDPIVGTYMQNCCMTENIGLTKFKADGSVVAANGFTGTWKLFDADTHTYALVINGEQLSVTYAPGRGLVSSGDAGAIVFKALK